MSVHELAKKSEISSQAIYMIEEGRIQEPREETRRRLSEALGKKPGPERARNSRESQPSGPDGPGFGEWLREARQTRDLTVRELADKSGLSQVAIYKIEAGQIANPRQSTRLQLSKALGEKVPVEIEAATEKAAEIAGLGSLQDFDPHDDNELPEGAGVYVFYDISRRPVYVGKTGDLRGRIRQHRVKFWFRPPVVETASYVAIPDKELRRQVESILIKFLKDNAILNVKGVTREDSE